MAGRSLPPTSRFAGDDGACPPALALALGEADDGARLRAVVAALAVERVLVPVVAHLDERAEPGEGGQGACDHGIAGEKVASAAMVTVRAPDGRAAVPAFSSVAALARWDATARPMPVEGVRAALAASAEADGLLVLDPGGPVTVLVPRPAVWALAQGKAWTPSAVDAEVRAGVAAALGPVPGVLAVRCEPGVRADLRVVLGVRPGLDRAALDAVVAAASEALAASPAVAERVDSLEVKVVVAPSA